MVVKLGHHEHPQEEPLLISFLKLFSGNHRAPHRRVAATMSHHCFLSKMVHLHLPTSQTPVPNDFALFQKIRSLNPVSRAWKAVCGWGFKTINWNLAKAGVPKFVQQLVSKDGFQQERRWHWRGERVDHTKDWGQGEMTRGWRGGPEGVGRPPQVCASEAYYNPRRCLGRWVWDAWKGDSARRLTAGPWCLHFPLLHRQSGPWGHCGTKDCKATFPKVVPSQGVRETH